MPGGAGFLPSNATASLRHMTQLQSAASFTLWCNTSWKCMLLLQWVLFAQNTLTTVLHFGNASPSLLLATIHQRSPSRNIDKKSVYNTGGYPERKANGPWKPTKDQEHVEADGRNWTEWGLACIIRNYRYLRHGADKSSGLEYVSINSDWKKTSDATRGTFTSKCSRKLGHKPIGWVWRADKAQRLIACCLVANL